MHACTHMYACRHTHTHMHAHDACYMHATQHVATHAWNAMHGKDACMHNISCMCMYLCCHLLSSPMSAMQVVGNRETVLPLLERVSQPDFVARVRMAAMIGSGDKENKGGESPQSSSEDKSNNIASAVDVYPPKRMKKEVSATHAQSRRPLHACFSARNMYVPRSVQHTGRELCVYMCACLYRLPRPSCVVWVCSRGATSQTVVAAPHCSSCIWRLVSPSA